MITIQYYLHTPKKKKSPLYVRVHPGDLRRSTGIMLKPSEWNHEKQKVKGHDYTDELNALLKSIYSKIYKAALEARQNDSVFTGVLLETILRPGKAPKVKAETPETVYKEWKEAYLGEKNLGRKDSDKIESSNYTRGFKPTVDWLEKFNPALSFQDLTKEETIKEFRRYLLSDSGLEDSSISKHLKNIRVLLNFKGHTTKHVVSPKLLKTTHYALTWVELQQLRTARLENPLHRQAADVFLITCQICLRYGDLFAESLKHLVSLNKNTKAVHLNQGKTGDMVYIPFPAMAAELMDRYEWVLPVDNLSRTNSSNLNKHLKDAAKLAGLTRNIRITSVTNRHITEEWKPLHELISIHDARHTGNSLVVEATDNAMLGEALLGHAKASDYNHANPKLLANKLLHAWDKIETDYKKEMEKKKAGV